MLTTVGLTAGRECPGLLSTSVPKFLSFIEPLYRCWYQSADEQIPEQHLRENKSVCSNSNCYQRVKRARPQPKHFCRAMRWPHLLWTWMLGYCSLLAWGALISRVRTWGSKCVASLLELPRKMIAGSYYVQVTIIKAPCNLWASLDFTGTRPDRI